MRIDSHIQIGGPDQGKLVDVNVFIEIFVSDRILLDLRDYTESTLAGCQSNRSIRGSSRGARLGSREAVLKERIRDLQDELSRFERRTVATQPAVPATSP